MTTNSNPGRVLAIVAAVVLLLVGAALAVSGAVLMAVFGTDGAVASDRNSVVTPTAAVVTDIAAIRDTSEVAEALGTPEATLAADGANLFVGIGRASDVDAYLANVELDQVVDLEIDPYSLNLSRRAGAEQTAAPPTEQKFWLASDTGAEVNVNWRLQDGDYRVVLMNADGSAGVDSRMSIGFGLSGLFGWSIGLLVAGAVLIIAAITLLVVTRPGRRRPNTPATAAGYPPPGGSGSGYAPQAEAGAGYAPHGGATPAAGYPPPARTAAGYPPPSGAAPAGYPPPAGNAAGYPPPPVPVAPRADYLPPVTGTRPAFDPGPPDPLPSVRDPLT